MKYLVTGGCGFLGSNLAAEVLRRGEELVVLDNLSRLGSRENYTWLQEKGEFRFCEIDVRDTRAVEEIVQSERPNVVFHVAGQVAMTTSLENPRLDFETNVVGTFNILEAVRRHCPSAAVLFSSTNKVYGDLESHSYTETNTRYVCDGFERGFNEEIPLDFRSPYGASKGAADQYMLEYHRSFGVKSVVFRHSSIYGGRQFSSYDQGWIGWFVKQAVLASESQLETPFTVSGTGKQVRDVLYASDLVRCYFQALDHLDAVVGQVFNIGGGYENSLSLLELFNLLEQRLETKLEYRRLAWRSSDQRVFIADVSKATNGFGWKPEVSKEEGIGQMLDWVRTIGENT